LLLHLVRTPRVRRNIPQTARLRRRKPVVEMATLFQSFRSSSMPKRLLRYALARLDFLDTDALDIDNLDFALGRNTVLEFRDVGTRLKVPIPSPPAP